LGAPAHDHRMAAQLGKIPLFGDSVNGIYVNVDAFLLSRRMANVLRS
jgi:hypothetical protein